MDIRVLRYFLAVAREESISGAAESLHLSQPTLSRQLSDLEEEIGKDPVHPREPADHLDGAWHPAAQAGR